MATEMLRGVDGAAAPPSSRPDRLLNSEVFMVEPQATRFWHAAVHSGLVDAGSLEACWSRIAPEKRTADAADRRLARKAVEMGLLTPWQAQQLLSGVRPQALRYDKYILLDLIGQGGMGRVFLSRDTRLGRRVAIKVLSRERMNNPRAVARFRREAKVGAQLQHENLVRIYDEGEAHGNIYLVMEYIEGKTVGRLLVDHGALTPPIAARVGRQVALGLDHLYQKGLLHRDINPMNILVDRDGTAKLTDLGLAIDLGEPEDIVTRDGATVGTFDYISPEQAKHSRSVDIRSDIYSLGCTIYHMLAGRVPFPQPSLPEKLYAHQLTEPDALTTLVPGIAPGLEAVIRRMMAKPPESRYTAPLAVAQALEPFQCGPVSLSLIEAAPLQSQSLSSGSGINGVPLSPVTPHGMGSSPEDSILAVGLTQVADVFGGSLKLDFGPEPRLSETGSTTRTVTGDEGRARLWLAAGGVAVLALLVALIVRGARMARDWGGSTTTTPAKSKGAPLVPGGPLADIAVHWLDDDTESPQPDLHSAIQTAVNKRAEVILRNTTEAMHLEVPKPYAISGGPVTIRAADGTRPVLMVTLAAGSPFIRVTSNGALKLIGLEIVFGSADSASKVAPLLIESAGDLAFDRCAFKLLTPSEREARVAHASGQRLSVAGCWFAGFDQPIAVDVYSRSKVRFQHSMFVGYKPGETPRGWLGVAVDKPTGARPRGDVSYGVTVERCTIVGAGLLALGNLSAPSPIFVTVRDTVVKSPALLMWPAQPPFPTGLSWSGRGNRYAVTGASWVVQAPGGLIEVPKAPTDLESWKAAGIIETDSKAEPVKLAAPSTSAADEPAPSGYAVEGPDAKTLGADPQFVGPGAKPVP
jgi:serine/threonine protein kinase